MGSFRFLEDVALADCAVEVTGASVSEVFETAALAFAEIIVNPATVEIGVTRSVSLEAPSLDLLLFEWISELIFRMDHDGEAFVRARVAVTGDGTCRLDAWLEGGPIVPGRTERRADAKGMTLHRLVFEPSNGGWHARFVVDL